MHSRYSLILPAAGRGSRMGQIIPKALTPFKGSTILEYQIEKFLDKDVEIVVVVNPREQDKFLFLQEKYELKFAVQKEFNGTANAIYSAINIISNDNFIVCWADQVGASKEIIIKSLESLENNSNKAAVVPLVYKKTPYVRAGIVNNKLVKWTYVREGCINEEGYTDIGVFACRKQPIEKILKIALSNDELKSNLTNEINFLDIFPIMDASNDLILMYLQDIKLTLAVNNLEELTRAENEL